MVTIAEMMVVLRVSDCAIKGHLLPDGPKMLALPPAVHKKGRRSKNNFVIDDLDACILAKNSRRNRRGSGVILLPPISTSEQPDGSDNKIFIKLSEKSRGKCYELGDAAKAFGKGPETIWNFAKENDVKVAYIEGKIFLERESFRKALIKRGHIKPE